MQKNKTIDYMVQIKLKGFDKKMQDMEKFPLISLEAPMGYGKTTFAKNFIDRSKKMYIWMAAQNFSKDYFWESFCQLIGRLDKDIVENLYAAGFPDNQVSASLGVGLIKSIKLQDDIIFVIDDYHMVQSAEMDKFFEALAKEEISNLHFVLIGRGHFDSHRKELILKNLLLTISWEDFRLTQEECHLYVNETGIHISEKELWELYNYTEGWITAIYLEIKEYAMYQSFKYPLDIDDLFEKSIYSKYSDDYKDFLLRICIFNNFTKEQARFIRRKEDPLQILEDIVAQNGFINRDSKTGNYHMHHIFSKFLQEKLKIKDVRYRNEVFRHSADWYYLNSQFFKATINYYKSGNFEDMLKSFEKGRGVSISGDDKEMMLEAFSACPKNILERHPIALMIYARQLFMMNEKRLLGKNLDLIKQCITDDTLTEREKNEYEGEYNMLMSFLSYNDLKKMNDYRRRAAHLLTKYSRIESGYGSFTFGSPSLLFMLHNKSGNLDELVEEMYNTRDLYYRLTNNNGRGSEYILDAEKEFFQNNLDRAEILSYKALNVAHKYKQVGIMICAYFLQARIYALKGKGNKSLKILDGIRNLVKNSEQYVFTHTADACKAFIYSIFNQNKAIEPWILERNFEEMGQYYITERYLYIIYGRILLNQEEYGQILGIADIFFEDIKQFSNIIAEIYLNIYVAVSYNKLNMRDIALKYVKAAVALAYEDKLYIPFVENAKYLSVFMKKSEFTIQEREFALECVKIYNQYKKNLSMILKEGDESPLSILTKREQEISLLVSEGKTNMEIAKELNVAEITIKKSLSNIYARLGISNRAALVQKINYS